MLKFGLVGFDKKLLNSVMSVLPRWIWEKSI